MKEVRRMGIIYCLEDFMEYIIPCVVVLLFLYRFASIPKFVFRKLLHLVAFSCVTLMILVAESWQSAALCSIGIAIVIYPVLALLEKNSWYDNLFVQKSPGEIKRSLVLLFLMFALVTAAAWGIFDRPDIAACAILMWGFGDGLAALVGIPFGRHKIVIERLHVCKSWEGSTAMFAISFLCGGGFLLFRSGYSLEKALASGITAALVGTVVELFTPSELDTVTVPVAILIVLLAGR